MRFEKYAQMGLMMNQILDAMRHHEHRQTMAGNLARANTEMDALATSIPEKMNGDKVAEGANDYLLREDFSTSEGLYVGGLDGQLIRYSGNGSMTTYGPPGTGKYRTKIAFDLAHVLRRTIIMLDPKGEGYLRSVDHRAKHQGEENIHAINPSGKNGIPSAKYNPLGHIKRKKERGEDIELDIMAIAEVLHASDADQKKQGDKETQWVKAESIRLSQIGLGAFAYVGSLKLSQLWVLIHQEWQDFWDALYRISVDERIPQTIRAEASVFISDYVEAQVVPADQERKDGREVIWVPISDKTKEYFTNIRQRLNRAVALYKPGGAFAKVTDETTVDVETLRYTPSSLFIVLDKRTRDAGKSWAALTLTGLMSELGEIDGTVKCTWIMDELTTLPPIKDYSDALLSMRSMGHQFLNFCHSRAALDFKYGKDERLAIENASAVITFWDQGNDIELCKAVSDIAGKTHFGFRAPGMSDGVDADSASSSIQFRDAPNATPGQVAGISDGYQCVLSRGYPTVGVMERPNYDDIPQYAEVIKPPIENLG